MTASDNKQQGSDAPTSGQPVGEESRQSLEAKISAMTVPEKVELAAKGNREVRRILSRDASSMVARALINSPLLSEEDIITFASSSQTNEDILRVIADNRQWTSNRQIVSAIVQNPRTPPPAAIRFLRGFATNELRIISNNRSVSVTVRQEAKRMLAQRN
ncbi:MAG: hypothetical protein FWF95_00710 [Syntrophorhabdaceae bacterium]|nr:hypothetical protein [Syntrophorhabdaceae bacterium]